MSEYVPGKGAVIDTVSSGAEYQMHKLSKILGAIFWKLAWSFIASSVVWWVLAYALTTDKQWRVITLTGRAVWSAITGTGVASEPGLIWMAIGKSAGVLALPWISLPALGVAALVWWAMGKHQKKIMPELYGVQHVRGSRVVPEKELQAAVDYRAKDIARSIALNREIAADIPNVKDLSDEEVDHLVIGRKLRMCDEEMAALAERVNAKVGDESIKDWVEKRIHIGETPIPPKFEMRNVLMVGNVGTGKSVAIKRMLKDMERAGQAAVIYDPTGEYVAHFYDPSRGDVLLSPILDKRSPAWNIWAEVEEPGRDYRNIAAALISSPETGEKFWYEAAQTLFVDTAEGLAKIGGQSNKALFDAAARWTMEQLEQLVDATASSRYVNKKAEKTGLSVLSTMVQQVDVMRHMPDAKPGEAVFSIRKWVRKQNKRKPGERGAFLFLLSDATVIGMMRNLLSLWLDIAAREIMASGDPLTREAKTWLVIDELASMGKIPVLPDTITQARKYGLGHLVGFQAVGQLNNLYGKEVANTILTNCGSKLILRCDGENAKYWSDTIGEQEYWETSSSLSYSVDSERNNESVSRKLSRGPAVMASELAGLPDLHGYLLLPGFSDKAKVVLNIRRMTMKNALYEPREMSAEARSLLSVMQDNYVRGQKVIDGEATEIPDID